MNEFKQLQKRVADGAVRVVYIEAVPRSISTALGRALNETASESLYVNEPLHRRNTDMDLAARHLLDKIEHVTPISDTPLTIITKNIARHVSATAFQQWSSLADTVIWSVRDPLVQIGSLLTRTINDTVIAPGADRLNQSKIAPYIKTGADILAGNGKGEAFAATSWANIGRHYRSRYQPDRSIVVDGTDFANNPSLVLGGICAALGLPFRHQMVNDWRSEYINVDDYFRSRLPDIENGWTKHFVSLNRVVPDTRPHVALSDLPTNLRTHISEVAIPTYRHMVSDVITPLQVPQ